MKNKAKALVLSAALLSSTANAIDAEPSSTKQRKHITSTLF